MGRYKNNACHRPVTDINAIPANCPLPDAPEADGWIRVEDKLPEYHEYVLVSDDNDTYIGRRIEDYDGFYDSENRELYNITNWQPLPKLPKKGGEK